MFLDAVHDIYLFQHITKPTRYRANTTANTLDLVFTNEEGMVDGIEYLPAIGSSDHVCLRFNLLYYSSYSQVSRPKYNLYQANFDTVRQLLQEIDWDDNLSPLDIHSALQFFATKFTSMIKECIPLYLSRKKKNIYATHKVFYLRNKKHKLWNKYMCSNSSIDFQHCSQVRNKFHKLTRTLCTNYENKLVSNVKSNPRQFWRYMLILN